MEITKILKKIAFILIELIHIFIFLLPTLIYFRIINSLIALKIAYFLVFLTPLHWIFFNDRCILDVIAGLFEKKKKYSHKTGYYHRNLFFVIKPLSRYFNLSITATIEKLVAVVLAYNAILLWHFIFFKNKCKLK